MRLLLILTFQAISYYLGLFLFIALGSTIFSLVLSGGEIKINILAPEIHFGLGLASMLCCILHDRQFSNL